MRRRVEAGLGLVIALAWLAPVRMDAQESVPVVSLESLETRAIERHPAVREAAARVEEARGRAAQAGAWQNPFVGGQASEWRPRESPSGVFGGFVEQTVTLGGKRAADRASAGAEVAVREAELETARLRVRLAVRVAYYELAGAAERLEVVERLVAVSEESLVITRQLVNVGIADRPDVLEAEAEAAGQRAALVATRAYLAGARHRIALAAADATLATQSVIARIDSTVPVLAREVSLAQILATSPEVRAADAAVVRERLGVDVERRQVFPDLTFRGEAGWNREHHPLTQRGRALGWQYGVDAGVTLPLFNRNRDGILAARSAVTSSEARAALVRQQIESRFAEAFEEYEAARVMADAYRAEILPRLEEAYDLYLARYREMATPYSQVLMAQRTLVTTSERYVDALTRAWQAAARVQGLLLEKEK